MYDRNLQCCRVAITYVLEAIINFVIVAVS